MYYKSVVQLPVFTGTKLTNPIHQKMLNPKKVEPRVKMVRVRFQNFPVNFYHIVFLTWFLGKQRLFFSLENKDGSWNNSSIICDDSSRVVVGFLGLTCDELPLFVVDHLSQYFSNVVGTLPESEKVLTM